jgi:hypothetical protein
MDELEEDAIGPIIADTIADPTTPPPRRFTT